MRGELFRELLVSNIGFRDDQKPRRVLVDPVNDVEGGTRRALPGSPPGGDRSIKILVFDEQVIRIKGCDGEDANTDLGQRRGQRCQDAHRGEWNGPVYPHTSPAALAHDALRHGRLPADDR